MQGSVVTIEEFLRGAGNNRSMLLESSCSEVENRKDEIDLPRGNFHFPRSGLPAKVWQLSSRGRRLRLDSQTEAGQSRSRKMKISLSANKLRLSDSPLLSNYFPAAWNYYSFHEILPTYIQSGPALYRMGYWMFTKKPEQMKKLRTVHQLSFWKS